MAFEKFEPSGRGRGSGSLTPKISVRKSGGFGINQKALDELFDDEHQHVVMYYDPDENKVGFEPREEQSSDTFTISRGESGASVVASSFVNTNDIHFDVSTHFEPVEEEDMIVIDLDDPVMKYGKPDEEEEDDDQQSLEEADDE